MNNSDSEWVSEREREHPNRDYTVLHYSMCQRHEAFTGVYIIKIIFSLICGVVQTSKFIHCIYANESRHERIWQNKRKRNNEEGECSTTKIKRKRKMVDPVRKETQRNDWEKQRDFTIKKKPLKRNSRYVWIYGFLLIRLKNERKKIRTLSFGSISKWAVGITYYSG